MSNTPGDVDPVAEFARAYLEELDITRDEEELARQVDDARAWAWAAIGAVNRRDHPCALKAVRRLLRDESSTVVAVEVLTGILLIGVPRGALKASAWLPAVTEDDSEAGRMATELLTGVARSDGGLVTAALHGLAGEQGADVLMVLVCAAAARIEMFVGVDGDTVDAYYQVMRDGSAGY